MTPKRKQEIGYLLDDIRKEIAEERNQLDLEDCEVDNEYIANKMERIEDNILCIQTEIEFNKNL